MADSEPPTSAPAKKEKKAPPANLVIPPKKPKLSKAERRALQEAQRSAKAGGGGGGGGGAAAPTKPTPKPSTAPAPAVPTPKVGSSSLEGEGHGGGEATGEASSSSSSRPKATKGGKNTGATMDDKTIELFSHLAPYRDPLVVIQSEYKYISQLHPSVIELGRDFAMGTIRGGNARCRAMLETFSKYVLEDYIPPSSSSTPIDYRTHLDHFVLKPSFTYWTTQCRQHSVSMGNAFTFLKSAVASLDRELPYSIPSLDEGGNNDKDGTTSNDSNNNDDGGDDEVLCAKQLLQESIQQFIQERLDYADQAIAQHAFTKIERGDVLMTFGYSEVISVLIETAAHELRGHGNGKKDGTSSSSGGVSSSSSSSPSTTATSSSSSSCFPFFVWVVDTPPLWEGRQLIQQLQLWNIPCGYITLNALGFVMDQNQQTKNKQVTKVFLGASALMTNGSVFGRAGTACVALLAQDYHIPVLVCCETYKISNRVPPLESITHNELGNPESILVSSTSTTNSSESVQSQQQHQQQPSEASGTESSSSSPGSSSSLSHWKDVPNLKLLHLLYDVTPSDFISGIITEVGIIPPTSVAVLLREMNAQDPAVS